MLPLSIQVPASIVLLAGGAAAAGWMALLGYALAGPGAIDLVTRNYVEYMTSARILIGGEIDKVISLLLVSALLAIAAGRARQLLERAVAEQAKARGVRLYTIGIGQPLDIDAELLRDMASAPDMFYYSPDGEDLAAIYAQIAYTIACPGGRHDWGKPWP